jgi:hypothetical protein
VQRTLLQQLGDVANVEIEIKYNNAAIKGKTSLFGKCMAKTHRIINSLVAVDAKAHSMSLELFSIGSNLWESSYADRSHSRQHRQAARCGCHRQQCER